MKTNPRSNRGFSVIDVIIAVSVIGVLSAIAYKSMPLILNLTRERAINNNVSELNDCVQGLLHSGTTFAQAAYVAPTQGTATTGATVTLPAASPSDLPAGLVTTLQGAGVLSMGHLTKINDGSTITAASYEYMWSSSTPSYPIFRRKGSALVP